MFRTATIFTVSNKCDSNDCLKDFQSINLPFLVLATLNGLYCFNDRSNFTSKLLYAVNRVYQLLFIGVIWYIAYVDLRHALGISDILRSQSLYSFSNYTWISGLALAINSFYIACHGLPWSKSLPAISQFRHQWNSLNIPRNEIRKCEKHLVRMQYIIFASSILYLAITITVYLRPITDLTIPTTLHDITSYLVISMWTFSGGYIVLFCISLCHIFSIANEILSPTQNIIQTNALQSFAILHQQATDLCGIFSRSFGFYILYAIIELSIELLIYLDLLIVGNLSINHIIEKVALAFISGLTLIVICLIAAAVNKQAYKSYDVINTIGCTEMKRLNSLQINELLFQQRRLGYNTIGIEIPGIGVIKDSTLATICSVFCTYLFLLVQFQIDARNEHKLTTSGSNNITI